MFTLNLGYSKRQILFVCSKNRLRSPTAEAIYREDPRVAVRSAGTSPTAVHVVSVKDVEWAKLIVCMEQKHKAQLQRLFPNVELPPIKVLEIPDEYDFMAPDLVELLKQEIEQLIAEI